MAMEMFAEYGVTSDDDPRAFHAANAFVAKLHEMGLFEQHIAQTMQELEDAGLMPLLRAANEMRDR